MSNGIQQAKREKPALTRDGQFVRLSPAPKEIARRLMTCAYHPTASESGVGSEWRMTPLFFPVQSCSGEWEIRCWAGLEPVIRRVAGQTGYRISPELRRESIPEPTLAEKSCSNRPEDRSWVRFVRNHERGLVRYENKRLDAAWLVAQIARAWPSLSVACVVGSYGEGDQLRTALSHYLPGQTVPFFNRRFYSDVEKRVSISTPTYLRHDSVRLEKRDILILPDASLGLRDDVREELVRARQARFYGFLSNQERYSRLESALLRGLFGFEEPDIPRHGCVTRKVETVWETVKTWSNRVMGGKRPGSRAESIFDLKRELIWRSHVRNRRISKLASALAGSEEDQSVVVLVENIEHALNLAEMLKDGPIVTGSSLSTTGLNRSEKALLRERGTDDPESPALSIVTHEGWKEGSFEADVMIRADGGMGSSILRSTDLVYSQDGKKPPLLLIDFNDRAHPTLRKWTRTRKSAYLREGWVPKGGNPEEARIDSFLAH